MNGVSSQGVEVIDEAGHLLAGADGKGSGNEGGGRSGGVGRGGVAVGRVLMDVAGRCLEVCADCITAAVQSWTQDTMEREQHLQQHFVGEQPRPQQHQQPQQPLQQGQQPHAGEQVQQCLQGCTLSERLAALSEAVIPEAARGALAQAAWHRMKGSEIKSRHHVYHSAKRGAVAHPLWSTQLVVVMRVLQLAEWQAVREGGGTAGAGSAQSSGDQPVGEVSAAAPLLRGLLQLQGALSGAWAAERHALISGADSRRSSEDVVNCEELLCCLWDDVARGEQQSRLEGLYVWRGQLGFPFVHEGEAGCMHLQQCPGPCIAPYLCLLVRLLSYVSLLAEHSTVETMCTLLIF